MYTVWHVDKYKITFKLVISHWINKGKDGRCLGLTTLPPSCADCLEIWEPQPPGTLCASPGL